MNSVLHAARRFAGENRREPDLGFRCGSASPVCYLISLGRRLSLDLHAARRRLGVVCQWIQMRLGVAWALSLNLDAAGRRLGDGF